MAGTSSNRAPPTMANGSRVPGMALENRWGTARGAPPGEKVLETMEGIPIRMRWGLLKPKSRMKVVVCCCCFHILSAVSMAMSNFMRISMDHFLGDGLNETKSATSGHLHTLLQTWPDGTEYVGQWRCSAVLQQRRYGPSRVVSMSFLLQKSR